MSLGRGCPFGIPQIRGLAEVSKLLTLHVMMITAVASLYGASMLSPDAQPVGYELYLHVIIAGALASAGSGALNHYYDRDIDPRISRTSTRPIPSGRLSAKTVLAYGLTLSCASVIYGYLLINTASTFFIALGIFSYVIIYTAWLKRRSSSNILAVGISGSAASWAGWTAATGTLDLLGFLVGLLVFIWYPAHYWTMGLMVRDKFEVASLPMLPFVVGVRRASKYILVNTLILVTFSLALYAFGMGMVYIISAAILGGLMLFYSCRLVKNPVNDFGLNACKVAILYQKLIFLAVALDGAFHVRI